MDLPVALCDGRRPTGPLRSDRRGRKLAQNPQIGAFRVHAVFERRGFGLGSTCGSILARVREPHGHEKPKGGAAKKAMPFASEKHHEFRTSDVRHLGMLDESLLARGMFYATTILENHSRAPAL